MIIYAKPEDFEKVKNSYHFLLANHISGIDHIVPPAWSEKLRILGSCNAFMKKSLMYFPILGQCMLYGCRFIFLDRSFEKDKENIEQQLSEFIKLKKFGATLFFPEGTRFTQQKHETSIEFAKSRNLPILKYHLTPRTKGFKTCVEVMKKMNEKCSILDYETVFKGEKPTFLNMIKGKRFEIHIFMESIPIENVETTDEWLFNLFQRKDELQESFEKFGNFYEGRNQPKIQGIEIKPRLKVLINFILWFIVTIFSIVKFSFWMIQNEATFTLIAIIIARKFNVFCNFQSFRMFTLKLLLFF
jgi:lysophosphatidic acid acyltransferase / lysophosphatidylinositol acyltransferase